MNARYGLKGLNKIISNVKCYERKPDIPLIKKAFFFARKMHEHQLRASKEPYFCHPVETAVILSELNADSATIAAALLHDVIEDTDVSERRLSRLFGSEVASLVEGVTKVDIVSRQSREAKQIASLQKVLLATVSDIRVLFIKLADKLHNLRTIKYLPKAKQKYVAAHALDVYAPLAHKLGIHRLKKEIEELSFSIIEPNEFAFLKKEVEKRRKAISPEIKELVGRIYKASRKRHERLSIYTIDKGIYNILTKIVTDKKTLDEIYDFTIVVILADSLRGCYECLGMVHSLFPPVARKLKDYIAIPQSNGYKSIHTTVIGPRGNAIKIYIRTKEMDEIAEKGMIIAKKSDQTAFGNLNKKISWLRRNVNSDFSSENGRHFMDSLKTDFLDKTIFFFDSRGKIHELPTGATPIDFAFHLGEKPGLKFDVARINGKEVPEWYEIQNGDVVDMGFSRHYCVSRGWLDLVKSKGAKKAIEEFFEKKGRQNGKRKFSPPTRLAISARDRIGLLADIVLVFKREKINIEHINTNNVKPGERASVDVWANFSNKKQLEKIYGKLEKIKGILSIKKL